MNPTLHTSASPGRLPWAVSGLLAGLLLGVLLAQRPPPRPSWASYAQVYAEVAPTVLNVSVEGAEARVGTGFAVAPDRVVTARHLVLDAQSIGVRGLDGEVLSARILGSDARTDLALLDVSGAALSAARLGRSERLMVGDTVLAIGNPYGLGHSLAVGVVGGRQRAIGGGSAASGFLQLTIPLNPGNSGGPIVDAGGQVVGVLAGTHARGQAIAFAVPVETLRDTLPALLRGDRLTRAWLGVRCEDRDGGAVVVAVVPAGPADRAGIRPGDRIASIAGFPVDGADALVGLLDGLPPGGKVSVVRARDGAEQVVPVVLADRAERSVVASGMTLRAAPGAGGEVVAVRPGSRAERAGVLQGDVVRVVAGFPVQAPADVQDLLADRGAVRLEVLRAGEIVLLTLEELG